MELLKKTTDKKTIRVLQLDITQSGAQAIVNPANSHLKHGGGVADAIVAKGGHIIQEESDKIGYVETGKAVITSAGKLKAKYVIHTVGPIWQGGLNNEQELLKKAVLSALNIAFNYKISSIAMPAISTGIFGFPKELGIKIIVDTVLAFIKTHELPKQIDFVNIDELTSNILVKYIKSLDAN